MKLQNKRLPKQIIFAICLLNAIPRITATSFSTEHVSRPSALEKETKPLASENESVFDWTFGASAEKTYLFTNAQWWESLDHQMTSTLTVLALGKNTSSHVVLPTLPSASAERKINTTLLGDFFDLENVKKVQPVMTLPDFLKTEDYQKLRKEKTGSIPLPKESQEEYESKLGIFGALHESRIPLQMPNVDPEHTNQKCNAFAGTMHLSSDGKTRYVFLDHIHFLHFCTERYMPWWYDIRHRIEPRKPYFDVVERYTATKKKPFSVIHLNDVMDHQNVREEEEIERYARQIVDALRKNEAISGTMYLIYSRTGKSIIRVVKLLKEEFENVQDCSNVYSCLMRVPEDLFDPPLGREHERLFHPDIGLHMFEWALGSQANLFVGNIHSPYSRNVCLYRKTHGRPYSVLKGFGEVRKIWSWNLLR